eukprot:scaffold421175_cov51-Attheya_sp.AAC.7
MAKRAAALLILGLFCSPPTVLCFAPTNEGWMINRRKFYKAGRSMALGDFTVELIKPLGIVLQEREAGDVGVQVASLAEGGAAEKSRDISPGDLLLKIGDKDVSKSDFDSVMDILVEAPADTALQLTLSDGLGRMDIAPNLARQLNPEDAILADQVVRAAVREIRRSNTSRANLGELLRVEIVIGAGVRENGRCMVRFFAIFSTDTVTTFSCSISATGVTQKDGTIDIIALTCAKDEGWGQTIDIIREVTD